MEALARTNPIVAAFRRLSAGSDPDHVLADRDRQLPTPLAWLEQGFAALPWFESNAPEQVPDLLEVLAQVGPFVSPAERQRWRARMSTTRLSPAQQASWEVLFA